MGAKDQRIHGKESRWAAIFDKASSYNGMKSAVALFDMKQVSLMNDFFYSLFLSL